VFVDRLTKMVHFAPSTDTISATGFADLFMSEIFRKHGLPESFVSDRDPRFTSHFFTAICQNLGIKQAMSTAFHPQTDGQTERANRTLEEMLRHYVSPNQDDWDLKLPCAEFAVNNAVKQATGFSPFYLNYGRHPRGPVTVSMDTNIPAANEFVTGLNKAISQAKDSLISAQASMKRNADSHRRDLEFAVGEQVLLSSKNLRLKTMGTKKLLPRFIGPFVILKRIGKLAYELELSQDMPKVHPVFHVSLLRPFTPESTPPPYLPTVVDGEPE
jgi:transposase InsO family protein